MFLMKTFKGQKLKISNRMNKFKLKFIIIGCVFVCLGAAGHVTIAEDRLKFHSTGRSLLFHEDGGGINCTSPAIDEFPPDLFTLKQRRHGAIFLHFFLTCYLFILLAFVCDDYFVPSIKTLCDLRISENPLDKFEMYLREILVPIVGILQTGFVTIQAPESKIFQSVVNLLVGAQPNLVYLDRKISIEKRGLHLSEDVAGATFMAAATSSPELFINVVGTFITKGDIGVGTIVGSAVFNILAVPACCGLFGGQRVEIDWWPLTRDCFAYGVTVVLLIISLHDGHIDWYEALILVVLYVFYIIAMYYNDVVSNSVKKFVKTRRKYKEVNLQKEVTPLLQNSLSHSDLKVQVDEVSTQENFSTTNSELNDGEALQAIPDGFWSRCFFFLSWPILLVLFLTIPDCRREKQKKLWPITFIMCIAWIASTSYLVSWMITVMGNTLSIPDSVMGLTFLAAGMSVPEATSSVIVTNQGHGAMGISSSIGSNTFDILLCLGLPWLIKSTFLPAESGKHIVKINSQGLGYSAMSLLTTLALLYLSFALNRFILDRKIGVVCLLMYISFLIFASMIELNVFFTVNLPLCGS